MRSSLVIPSYIEWHYTDALRNIWGILTNFVWFIYHFFSTPALLKTLFLPWQMTEENSKSAAVNFFLCSIGFIIRGSIIVFAFVIIAALFCAGIIFYILWFLFPFILFILFTSAVWLFSV